MEWPAAVVPLATTFSFAHLKIEIELKANQNMPSPPHLSLCRKRAGTAGVSFECSSVDCYFPSTSAAGLPLIVFSFGISFSTGRLNKTSSGRHWSSSRSGNFTSAE